MRKLCSLGLLSAISMPALAGGEKSPYPIEAPAPQEPAADSQPTAQDRKGFEEMLKRIEIDPEFAGSKIGLAWGTEYRIIDRTSEAVAAKAPKPETKTALTQAIGEAISRSASSSIAVRFTYEKHGIDENGKPYTETVTIDAGMATGAAAEAQNSMNEAMGKNHQ